MSVNTPEKRRRLIYVSLLVIALGVASRALHFESVILNKYLGDALYAMLFYLIISIIAGYIHPLTRAGITFGMLIILELFQLTQIPLALSQNKNMLIRIIAMGLGTVFSWLDLLAYLVGIMVIVIIEKTIFEK